jgi:soluble lytic murein transglycosylase-like protein
VPAIVPGPSPPLAQAIPPSAALPATLPAPAPAPVPSAAPSPAAVQALAPSEEAEAAINVARNQMSILPRPARAPAALSAFRPAPDRAGLTVFYALPLLAAAAGLGLALALGGVPRRAGQPGFVRQGHDLGRGPTSRGQRA